MQTFMFAHLQKFCIVKTMNFRSILSAFVFSAVRDGYYGELRRQRKSSNAFRSRPSVDVSTDGSVSATDNGSSRRLVLQNYAKWGRLRTSECSVNAAECTVSG